MVSAVVLAPLFDCTSFTPIPADTCGNDVVEPGPPGYEDCDSFGEDAGLGTKNPACGQPGTGAAACRFVCGTAAGGAACPAGVGYGCGSDGICRRPSGSFTAIGGSVAAGAWRASLADFDGDGLLDAFTWGKIDGAGFSQARIQYFDRSLAPSTTFAPAPLVGSPQVIDMNGDQLADVVFEYRETNGIVDIGVMTGSPSRTLIQVPYPVIDLPGQLRYYVEPFYNGTFLTCAFNQVSGVTQLLDLSPSSPTAVPETVITDLTASSFITSLDFATGPQPTLVGGFVLAPIFRTPSHPCDNLIFAYGADAGSGASNTANVVSPCTNTMGSDDNWGDVATVQVHLAQGVPEGSPQVADVNGDGYLDILIPATASGAGNATLVAYSDGKGTFYQSSDRSGATNLASDALHALPPPADGGSTAYVVGGGGNGAGGVSVIATADINGDGVADFVTTQSILLSNGAAAPYSWAAVTDDHSWTDAIIADFNHDGALDVFAGNASVPNLDFFAGAAPGASSGADAGVDAGDAASASAGPSPLAPFFLATSGGASHFSVGDYDGDGTNDLAFKQVDLTSDQSDDVVIVYGVPLQFPGAPVLVGRFGSVQETLTVPPQDGAPLSLVVVSTREEGDGGAPLTDAGAAGDAGALLHSRITYLPATGTRPPLSSYRLTNPVPKNPVFGHVESFVAATFAGATYPDVAALAYDLTVAGNVNGTKDDTWFLPSGGPAQFNEAVDETSPALPSLGNDADDGKVVSVLMAAGLVNKNDPRPESIVVAPSCAGCADGTLLVGKFSGGAFKYTQTALPGISVSLQGQLALADVDGDGALDVVILSGSIADPGGTTTSMCGTAGVGRSLWVLWNDGTGHFSQGQTPAAGGSDYCSSPQAFTFLNVSGGPTRSIAYVSRSGVSVLEPAQPGSPRTLVPHDLGPGTPDAGDCCSPGYTGSEYTGIAGGDIDGDGVDDFLLVNNGNLQVWKGVAANTAPPVTP